MARDDATVLDIANAARLIQTFIQGMTKKAFLGDLKTQSAVLHQVMVIGEAVKRLSETFRERQPHKAMGLTAYSIRSCLALASGRSSYLAICALPLYVLILWLVRARKEVST